MIQCNIWESLLFPAESPRGRDRNLELLAAILLPWESEHRAWRKERNIMVVCQLSIYCLLAPDSTPIYSAPIYCLLCKNVHGPSNIFSLVAVIMLYFISIYTFPSILRRWISSKFQGVNFQEVPLKQHESYSSDNQWNRAVIELWPLQQGLDLISGSGDGNGWFFLGTLSQPQAEYCSLYVLLLHFLEFSLFLESQEINCYSNPLL